jgi:hypothetical protein
MKVIISETRLEEIVFKYLDIILKDLEQVNGKHVDIIFKYSYENRKLIGELGWEEPDKLWVSQKLVNKIFQVIPLGHSKIQKIIGKYIKSKFGLEVKNTLQDKGGIYSMLYIPKI